MFMTSVYCSYYRCFFKNPLTAVFTWDNLFYNFKLLTNLYLPTQKHMHMKVSNLHVLKSSISRLVSSLCIILDHYTMSTNMHYYLNYILKALNCHYMSINSISVSLIIRLWNLWIFLLNIQCICPLNLSCLLILVPWITINMFNVHGLSILLSIKSCLFIVLFFDILILSIVFLFF